MLFIVTSFKVFATIKYKYCSDVDFCIGTKLNWCTKDFRVQNRSNGTYLMFACVPTPGISPGQIEMCFELLITLYIVRFLLWLFVIIWWYADIVERKPFGDYSLIVTYRRSNVLLFRRERNNKEHAKLKLGINI